MADPITSVFVLVENLQRQIDNLKEQEPWKKALVVSAADQCLLRRYMELYPHDPLVEALLAKNVASINDFFPNTLPYLVELQKVHISQLEREKEALARENSEKQSKIIALESQAQRHQEWVRRQAQETLDRNKARAEEKAQSDVVRFQLNQQISISDGLNAKCKELADVLAQRDDQIRNNETKTRPIRPFIRYCQEFIGANERFLQANDISTFKHELAKAKQAIALPEQVQDLRKRPRE